MIKPTDLEALADWFDVDDKIKAAMAPGMWPGPGQRTQAKLRRWARFLRDES